MNYTPEDRRTHDAGINSHVEFPSPTDIYNELIQDKMRTNSFMSRHTAEALVRAEFPDEASAHDAFAALSA
jgi:hypothetical protein